MILDFKNLPDAPIIIVDKPGDPAVTNALKQLGIPNLFARAVEFDEARLVAAFDNHPTHWLVISHFQGSDQPNGDGLSLYGYPKSTVSRSEMEMKLVELAKEIEADRPLSFFQLPE
ncbi:hypothetical protein [Synoicihabitans lomoniglobus]|uniref:Uncharacterized protein n=1 Tax=Synoicihabitans lomoniglobus TaxID=2909285 RepID=A0AAF0CPW1_9BACT|nr:hypothetical protein [Opitutaceae bacterium LMO-M01]WED65870.1 hypothetical protein PXH66_03285 [Opitutaceae bacterium LMO-M01]